MSIVKLEKPTKPTTFYNWREKYTKKSVRKRQQKWMSWQRKDSIKSNWHNDDIKCIFTIFHSHGSNYSPFRWTNQIEAPCNQLNSTLTKSTNFSTRQVEDSYLLVTKATNPAPKPTHFSLIKPNGSLAWAEQECQITKSKALGLPKILSTESRNQCDSSNHSIIRKKT